MPTYGPKLASSGTTQFTGGKAWSNASNVSSTSSFATSDLSDGAAPMYLGDAYVTTNGISTAGTNQGSFSYFTSTPAADQTLGGAANLWGRSWSLSNIKGNASFGVVLGISDDTSADFADYLIAKGFDFTEIPDGETIVGVEFKLEWKHTDPYTVSVRNVRCTVTTSGGGGGGGTGAAVNHYRNQGMR